MRGEDCVSKIDPLKQSSIIGELHLIRLHTPAGETSDRRVKRKPVPQKCMTFNTDNVNSELRLGANVVVLPHDEDLAFSDGDETQSVHLQDRNHTHTHNT